MPVGTIIVATDGSELSIRAAVVGVALVDPSERVMVVTVVEGADPSLTEDGSGHAGPSMTPSEFSKLRDRLLSDASEVIAGTVAALSRDVETQVIEGSPGEALCELARDESADAIILGTRGRSGIKRALFGSVSDHVIRNATCPVVITRG